MAWPTVLQCVTHLPEHLAVQLVPAHKDAAERPRADLRAFLEEALVVPEAIAPEAIVPNRPSHGTASALLVRECATVACARAQSAQLAAWARELQAWCRQTTGNGLAWAGGERASLPERWAAAARWYSMVLDSGPMVLNGTHCYYECCQLLVDG